jgi:transposase-like protein
VSDIELDFAVLTHEPFRFQVIATEARAMRRLGMKFRAIATALGVSEKTVWKALAALDG